MNINGETAAIESNSLISNDGTCDIKLNNNTIEMKADSVVMSGDVYGDKFIINNYTGDLGYLMTDGSILTTSQQGQPNIYLYTNSNVITVPPASGQVRANFPDNVDVTRLYISHITAGQNIDIEVFLNQISVISIIYMQSKLNSQNYVRFTVTAAPTTFPNSYIEVPVLYLDSGGNGDTDLGGGADIFLSIFDNSPLVDARLSSVETKTQHQTANINETIFNKPILMNNNKISNLGTPTAAADAVTKLYTDTADALKVSKSGDTMSGALDMGANKITSTYVPIANNDLTNKLYTDNLNNLKVNKSGDTMSGILNMGNNIISNLGTPLNSSDAANKLYVENLNNLKVSRSGDTMTGNLDMGANKITSTYVPLANNDLTNKLYTDNLNNLKVNKSGDTMSGILNMGNNIISNLGTPLNILDAVNKLYTDNRDALQLNLTGGTLTGALDMGANKITSTYVPLANNDLTNKLYVDNIIVGSSYLPLAGGTMSGDINLNNNDLLNINTITFFNNSALSYRQVTQINTIQTSGTTETIITGTPQFGSYSWADAIGQSRTLKFMGTQVRAQPNATTYTFRIKANGLTMATFITRASPATTATGNSQPYELNLTLTRYNASEIYFYGRFDNVEHPSFFSIISITNIPTLGTNATYSVTAQSNVAQSSLFAIAAETTSILN